MSPLRMLATRLRQPSNNHLDALFADVLDAAVTAAEAELADPFLDREVLRRLTIFAARAVTPP